MRLLWDRYPIYVYIYLSLSISIYIYLYLSISIYIYLYLSISIYIYLYLSISIYIYLYLSISYLSLSISIYLYLSLSISIYLYLSLSISIYLYLSLSISIYLSIYILTIIPVRSQGSVIDIALTWKVRPWLGMIPPKSQPWFQASVTTWGHFFLPRLLNQISTSDKSHVNHIEIPCKSPFIMVESCWISGRPSQLAPAGTSFSPHKIIPESGRQ